MDKNESIKVTPKDLNNIELGKKRKINKRTKQDAVYITFGKSELDKNGRYVTNGKDNEPNQLEVSMILPGMSEIEDFQDAHRIFEHDPITGEDKLDSKGEPIRNDYSKYGGSYTGYSNYLRPHLRRWLKEYFMEEFSNCTLEQLVNSICVFERKPLDFIQYLFRASNGKDEFYQVE